MAQSLLDDTTQPGDIEEKGQMLPRTADGGKTGEESCEFLFPFRIDFLTIAYT